MGAKHIHRQILEFMNDNLNSKLQNTKYVPDLGNELDIIKVRLPLECGF